MAFNNPISNMWLADPEAREYNGEYWIYVTNSDSYENQKNLSVIHSKDLNEFEVIPDIIDMPGYPHANRAIWAPSVVEKDGRYYIIFACNDIQSDDEIGGLEMGASDSPQGPFKSYCPTVVDKFVNGAQPIDAHFFKDDDGTIYLLYGGWGHCNIAVMNDTMDGFVPFENGEIFKEITPEGYTEGPCMFKRNGKYYFMWSSGNWTNGTYCVNYGIADKPYSEFDIKGLVLASEYPIAKGPGHNGFLHLKSENKWLVVYHRHFCDDDRGNARFICIDEMNFDGENILPIKMT